jgi:hypothetical protein
MVYGRYNELSSIHGVYKQAYNGGGTFCSRRIQQLLVQ